METSDKTLAIPKKINLTALIVTIVLFLAFLVGGILSLNTSKKVVLGSNTVSLGTQNTEFTFTPTVSGTYTFTTQGTYDTSAALYRGTTSLAYNDDGGDSLNFFISQYCTADTTYTLKISSSQSCKVILFIAK